MPSGVPVAATWGARFQFGVEELHDAGLAAQTQDGFAHHVGAEKGEEIETLAGVEEGVGQLHGVLRVDVVVGEAVNEQDRAAQF